MKGYFGPRTQREHSITKFQSFRPELHSLNTGAAENTRSTLRNSASSNTKSSSWFSNQGKLIWSETITEDLSYKTEGAWLSNEPQQMFCQFTSHRDGSRNELICLRNFHWRPPDDPIPQGSQLMTRQEALEKWNTLKSMGWKKCAGPLQQGTL